MDVNEIKDKAQDALATAKDKVGDVLGGAKEKIDEVTQSDKFEEISDKVIDGAAGIANKVTGDRYKDQIDSAADAADEKIGRDDAEQA